MIKVAAWVVLFAGMLFLFGCTFVITEPNPKVEEPMSQDPVQDTANIEEVAPPELVRTIELAFFPHDIALDRDGNLYIVEYGEARIHKLDATGAALAMWGSEGSGAGQFAFRSPPGGPPLDGGFVTVDEDGTVYVSDTFNNRIQIFDGNGTFLRTWEKTGIDGTGFNTPGPISTDLHGHVYIADLAGDYQFTTAGTFVRTLKAVGEVGVDSYGNYYSPNAFDDVVIKFGPDGAMLETWGSAGTRDGQFTFPLFLAVDEHDHIFVADRSGRIQMLSSRGEFLAAWNHREGGDSPFTTTASIALDLHGNLYAASTDRNKIYVYSIE